VENGNGSVVVARDVTRRYGAGDTAVDALRGVSVDVPAGQLTAVMGPSGSGKSTLMHILAGLDKPTSGSVTVAGREITTLGDTDLTRLRREHIGFVFQFFNLLPMLNAEENILLPAWANSIPGAAARLAWIYSLMPEVAELRHRRALQLSGGQQKLVALARALMPGTKLLLLDEPFEGVAPVLSRRLTEVIGGLRKQGLSVILSESDAKHSADLVDLVFNIERGSVTQG
jgi:branched-chain amino acid transport system ATP-binding protein